MKDPQTAHTDLIFLRALDAEQSSHLLFLYARFLDKCGREERANEYFLRSLEGDPNNPRALEAYAGFLNEYYPTPPQQHHDPSSPSSSQSSPSLSLDPFSPSNISDLFFARRSLVSFSFLRSFSSLSSVYIDTVCAWCSWQTSIWERMANGRESQPTPTRLRENTNLLVSHVIASCTHLVVSSNGRKKKERKKKKKR